MISGLAVAADRGHALCALGRGDEAAAAAERLVDAHRFYEPAWGLLMCSLYHSGRQRDALAAYTRARDVFVSELGLDPPPALAELQRRILDRTLAPPAAAPALVTTPDEPSGSDAPPRLPELPSSLIGRDTEIERVEQLLGSGTRLVTLVGLGGIGKTTVALAVGHRLAAAGTAVAFVDLAGITRAASAMPRLCEAASVRPGADAAADLAQSDPEIVLIADNVEQVDDFATAVAHVVARSRRLTLLVTSRTASRVRAEHLVTIGPLPTTSPSGAASAGQLFVARARQLRGDLELSGRETAVVEICELAGGIPLAIEIAVRRLGHQGPAALLDRLRRQRALLLDGTAAVDVPDRQQSLRTVLDATTALLSPGALGVAAAAVRRQRAGHDQHARGHEVEALGAAELVAVDAPTRTIPDDPILQEALRVGARLQRERRQEAVPESDVRNPWTVEPDQQHQVVPLRAPAARGASDRARQVADVEAERLQHPAEQTVHLEHHPPRRSSTSLVNVASGSRVIRRPRWMSRFSYGIASRWARCSARNVPRVASRGPR